MSSTTLATSTTQPAEPYVVTLGESMGLLSTDSATSLAHASHLALGTGGAEANVATGLVRLGARATWIGCVGADSLGERVLRELRAEGVDVRARVVSSAPTGLMLKERRTAGTARVWYYRSGSAGSQLAPSDIDEELVAGAALLHVSGITAGASASASAAVERAVQVARQHAVPVSFDVNHRASVWARRDPGATYRALAASADIVFTGLEEGSLLGLGPGDADSLARAIADLGPQQVLVKLGAQGCLARVDGATFHREAVPVEVVDTVGAGDAFVAGYLAEHLLAAPVQQRLTTAVTAGAFACLSAADWEGLPRRTDLSLLGEQEPVQR